MSVAVIESPVSRNQGGGSLKEQNFGSSIEERELLNEQ
jgi:hypothetical protein